MTLEKAVEPNLQILVAQERDLARYRAIDALARYKFERFGYWASTWVTLNNLNSHRQPNPFVTLVKLARSLKAQLSEKRGTK